MMQMGFLQDLLPGISQYSPIPSDGLCCRREKSNPIPIPPNPILRKGGRGIGLAFSTKPTLTLFWII